MLPRCGKLSGPSDLSDSQARGEKPSPLRPPGWLGPLLQCRTGQGPWQPSLATLPVSSSGRCPPAGWLRHIDATTGRSGDRASWHRAPGQLDPGRRIRARFAGHDPGRRLARDLRDELIVAVLTQRRDTFPRGGGMNAASRAGGGVRRAWRRGDERVHARVAANDAQRATVFSLRLRRAHQQLRDELARIRETLGGDEHCLPGCRSTAWRSAQPWRRITGAKTTACSHSYSMPGQTLPRRSGT